MADPASRLGDKDFQRRIARALKAFAAREVAPYRAAVKALLEEARALKPLAVTARLEALLRLRQQREGGALARRGGFDGLEPVVRGYLTQMNSNRGGIDRKALADLQENPAFKSAVASRPPLVLPPTAEACNEFWSRWARGELPPGMDDGFIPCLVSEPSYDQLPLTDPLVLLAVEPCSEFAYVLTPPADIPQGFQADVLPGPPLGGVVQLGSDGRQVALYTQALFRVPLSARTEQFTLRLTTGAVRRDFAVTLPVTLSIHTACEPAFDLLAWSFLPGENVSIAIFASGPRGPLRWSWNPIDGAPLPAGLVLEERNGDGWIHGQVQEGASSSRAYLRLEAGNQSVERQAAIRIPVHLAPTDRDDLARLRDLTRGQAVRIPLPWPTGGDGDRASYSWAVDTGSALPDGLAITHHDGAWWVEGTVAETAPVETRRISLRMDGGPSEVSGHVALNLRVGVAFRVWTQNCMLFMSEYISTASLLGICGVSVITGAGAVCALAGEIAGAWHGNAAPFVHAFNGIPNTDEDNEQRTDFLLDHLRAPALAGPDNPPYDLVALQEVWEGPFSAGVHDRLISGAGGLGYSAREGPGHSGVKISSGLILLVRDSFSAPEGEHRMAAFTATPDLGDAIQHGNFDGMAEKGFTLDRVHLGADPESFIFVVNTHLQADEDGDQRRLREQQLDQLRSFVDANTVPTHPVLMMGDFNVVAGSDEYRGMLARLGGPEDLFADGGPFLTDDQARNAYAFFWGNRDPHARQQLDYVLVRQGTRFSLHVGSKRLEDEQFNTFLCRDPRHVPATGWLIGGNPTGLMQCYLSDHFGLSAVLRFIST